ncbi:hypothetical protein LX64_02287 [Chitinophaga skermanii]|uniref:Uncharacterized protein n=1 Tax=Chitinophaga skermanii TaxID=331697 RepID=A0A327QP59_9BACT|nr:hypothetical protein [Chitinophaga skermanii]RAJ05133.1 hypothetical protein LX64_02287 [Chitinophaga skermanii]
MLDCFQAVLVILAVCIFIPAMLVIALPFALLLHNPEEKNQFEEKYKAYLDSINGACIFCYTNNKISAPIIENMILSLLPSCIHVVKLEGKSVQPSSLDKNQVSSMLYRHAYKKGGFPYLLRVENGDVQVKSLKRIFFDLLNQQKDLPTYILQEVDSFFSTKEVTV